MKKIIFLLVSLSILLSCKDKPDPQFGDQEYKGFFLYKIKDTSYFNYTTVMVNTDVTKIIATLGTEKDIPDYRKYRPLILDSSYYYEPSIRKNGTEGIFTFGAERTAIVDVKIADNKGFNSDTMLKHIVSSDLFTEFYEEIEPYYITNTSPFAQDTAMINGWIRKGELGKHLKKLK